MKNQTLKLVLIAALIGGAFYFMSEKTNTFGLAIPKVKAIFEDNLQSKITSTATSMTLIDGTDKQSRNLSGNYGFVIDEGNTIEEFIICDASGTALTNCLRGIDVEDGETEVATLQQPHRRGVSVKITNFPQLAIISRILNGDETAPNLLTYANREIGTDSSASSTSIMSKGYMDSLAISGAPTSTYDQIGMSMDATRTDAASTTASSTTGASQSLISANSSSTPSANLTDRGWVPVTEDDGQISQLYLRLSEEWAFTGGITTNKATTTRLVVGPTNPTFNLADGDLYVGGNATGTNSFDIGTLCFAGAFCLSSNGNVNLFSTSTTNGLDNTGSITTIFTVPVPANALTGTNMIVGSVPFVANSITGSGLTFTIGIWSDGTEIISVTRTWAAATGTIEILYGAKGVSNLQTGTINVIAHDGGTNDGDYATGDTAIDMTSATNLLFRITTANSSAHFKWNTAWFDLKQNK